MNWVFKYVFNVVMIINSDLGINVIFSNNRDGFNRKWWDLHEFYIIEPIYFILKLSSCVF